MRSRRPAKVARHAVAVRAITSEEGSGTTAELVLRVKLPPSPFGTMGPLFTLNVSVDIVPRSSTEPYADLGPEVRGGYVGSCPTPVAGLRSKTVLPLTPRPSPPLRCR